jgi:hypothetical protein
MLGANVGYYEHPKGGFGVKFPASEPPVWLRQMAASAHVPAMVSTLSRTMNPPAFHSARASGFSAHGADKLVSAFNAPNRRLPICGSM